MNDSRAGSDLLTLNQELNQKMIRRVYTNVGQDLILVTTDKVRLCLGATLKRLEDRKAWIAPAGILVALLAVPITTATYQDVLFIPKESWKTIFIMLALATSFWLAYCLFRRFAKPVTIDGIVDELRKDSLPAASPQLQGQPEDGLRIMRASYGAGATRIDVTAKLSRLVGDGELHTKASNELAGDPCLGTVKDLVVEYQYNGQVLIRTVQENADLDLP